MVKIPKFADFKKMGGDLAQSAKNTKIFDKIKDSVDSLGAGSSMVDHGNEHEDDCNSSTTPLERCVKLVGELQELRRMENNLFTKLKAELNQLAKANKTDEASNLDQSDQEPE